MWSHEVSNLAVYAASIGTNAEYLLDDGVREVGLKVESGKNVRKATDSRPDGQRPKIAANDRLSETLVVVAWDDGFGEGRHDEPTRLDAAPLPAEMKILSCPVILAVIQA